MFASLSAVLAESSLAIFAVLALLGAIASFIYLPVVGRPLAAVLLAVSAALGAYDAGFIARGRQDESAALAAQLAEEKRQSEASQQIAQAAAARERAAADHAAALNEKVAAYEQQLAVRSIPQNSAIPQNLGLAQCPKVDFSLCGCALSDADVRGLRNISPAGSPAAAGRPGAVRPPGRRP